MDPLPIVTGNVMFLKYESSAIDIQKKRNTHQALNKDYI